MFVLVAENADVVMLLQKWNKLIYMGQKKWLNGKMEMSERKPSEVVSEEEEDLSLKSRHVLDGEKVKMKVPTGYQLMIEPVSSGGADMMVYADKCSPIQG